MTPDTIVTYLRHLEVERRLSVHTLDGYGRDLARLRVFAEGLGREIVHLDRRDLEGFVRDAMAGGLSPSSTARLVASVRGFYLHLRRRGDIGENPADDLHAPKAFLSLPRFLSMAEVDALLAAPDVSTPGGLRDRALIEVLYATGIRRMELANLTIDALNFGRGTLFVREGKGKKDRLVPVGERALAWIQKYLDDARPEFVVDVHERALFLNRHGQGFSEEGLTGMIRAWFKQAGISKPGSCHLFRHTMATVMLDNGADVRFVQMMLGHANLDTTQGYTHVAIGKLIAIHAATHPGARLQRKPSDPDTHKA